MALHKAREFSYRPPRNRERQAGTAQRAGIRIPRAGEGRERDSSAVIRLVVMLAAIAGLIAVLLYVRF